MKQIPTHAQVEVEVRYAETDQMGVVHHATYLVWFEVARTRLCALSGFHYAELERRGHLLMVTGAELKFRRSLRYGDTAEVTAWLDHLGSRGMKFAYEVHRTGELCVTGTTEHLWVDASSGRPMRCPAEVEAPFAALAETRSPSQKGASSPLLDA